MKILVIGGTGTIGSYIVNYYNKDHEVIVASRRSKEYPVEISNLESLQKLFDKVGKVDAIVCAAGEARWAPYDALTEDDYHIGLNSKLMGQVNIARIGREHLNPRGSITLTTGILADDPVVKTTSAAMVNGAIHSFVRAAVLEITDGSRLNVVSCGMVADAYEKYKGYFPGHPPVSMERMMFGYVRAIEGAGTGEIIRIYE